MKIDYISDLHINHYVHFKANQEKWKKHTVKWSKEILDTSDGDVLIVAGDFSEFNRQGLWFLEEASKQYEQVFIVIGNHDYYLLSKNQKNKYMTSFARVQEFIDNASKIKNVTPLDKKVAEYNGVTFAGDSLWYRLDSFEDIQFFKGVSNDSNYIYGSYGPGENSSREIFQESMNWYETLESMDIDVMISHIPPLHPPISHFPRNACYDFPAPFLVGKHWICGHQHIIGEFHRFGVHFHMNPLGYPNEGNGPLLSQFEI